MVAGEASGDLLASLMLQGLRQRWPELAAHGVGGPAMAAEGFEAWWPSSRLAVRGYAEVLRQLPGLLRIRRALRERLLLNPPRLFVGVDAPDFNLKLEEDLKASGIPVVHFVCPSIWAWRPQRVHQIRRSVDEVLCIFPFEPELLAAHGIAATYVGHPLADAIPLKADATAARQALGLQTDRPVIALLPGSRAAEVTMIAPSLLRAAALLRPQIAGAQFVWPVAPGLRPQAELALKASGAARQALGSDLKLVDGRSHEVLAACDLTLIASGTATLEAALFKKPMVITYRMHPVSWRLMRRKALQPWVGLPNILTRSFVVPELIQDACTPERIAQEALSLWKDATRRHDIAQRFDDLHGVLRCHAAQRATQVLARWLEV